jgi:hypothetical protein
MLRSRVVNKEFIHQIADVIPYSIQSNVLPLSYLPAGHGFCSPELNHRLTEVGSTVTSLFAACRKRLSSR